MGLIDLLDKKTAEAAAAKAAETLVQRLREAADGVLSSYEPRVDIEIRDGKIRLTFEFHRKTQPGNPA